MENEEFRHLLGRYRQIMLEDVLGSPKQGDAPPGIDWLSDLYAEGTRRCAQMADEFLEQGSTVLDYGCGMGLMSVLLERLGHEVSGIDIDIGSKPEMVAAFGAEWGSYVAELEDPRLMARSWEALSASFGVRFLSFDGRIIPFEKGSFDGLVMHAVFEHLPVNDLPAILGEAHRVLDRKGHLFVFRTPRESAYLERFASALGRPTHERLCSEGEVIRVVSAAGFSPVACQATDMLPSFLPAGQRLYNRAAPLATSLDAMLLSTRLRKYAHHMALVFQRC